MMKGDSELSGAGPARGRKRRTRRGRYEQLVGGEWVMRRYEQCWERRVSRKKKVVSDVVVEEEEEGR